MGIWNSLRVIIPRFYKNFDDEFYSEGRGVEQRLTFLLSSF